MKPYTVQVDIDRARDEVVEKFLDTEGLFHWQTGLQSVDLISGNPFEPGAKSQLVFENNGRTIELTETILEVNLPESISAFYEWSGGMNTLENRFIELDAKRTRWESTCSYTFGSLGMKLMGFLMPGAFRRQNQSFLDNFKRWVEST